MVEMQEMEKVFVFVDPCSTEDILTTIGNSPERTDEEMNPSPAILPGNQLRRKFLILIFCDMISMICQTIKSQRSFGGWALYLSYFLIKIFLVYAPIIFSLVKFYKDRKVLNLVAVYFPSSLGFSMTAFMTYWSVWGGDVSPVERRYLQTIACFHTRFILLFLLSVSLWSFALSDRPFKGLLRFFTLIQLFQTVIVWTAGLRPMTGICGDVVMILGIFWILSRQVEEIKQYIDEKMKMFKILTSENEGLHREVLVQGNATTSVMEDCELVLASTWAPLFAVNVEGLINVWSRGMVSVTGLQKATGLRIEELSLTEEAKVDVINVLQQILHGATTTVDFKMVFTKDTGNSVSLVMTAVARRDVNRDVIGIYCSGHQINKYAQAPAPDIMALLPWGSSTMTETEQLALEGEEACVEGERACLEAETCLEGEEASLEGEKECLEGEEEHLEGEEACLQGNEVGFSRPIARPIARRPSSERSRYTSTDRPNSTTSNDDENQADSVSSHIQSLDRTHSSQRHCGHYGELPQFVCIAMEDEASSIGIELLSENPSPENAREVKPLPSHSTSRPVSALSASSGMDWIRSWSRSSSEPPSKMHGLPKRAATVDEADTLGKNFVTSSDPAEGDDRPILQFCQQRGITILSVEDGEEPPTNHLKLISHVDVTGQHSMLRSKTLLKPGAQHSGQLYGHAYDQRNVDDASESSGTKSRLDSLKMMLSGRWSNSNSAMSNDLPVLNERAIMAGRVDVSGGISVTSSDPAEEDGEEPPKNHIKFISHVDVTRQHSMMRSKTLLKPQVLHCAQRYKVVDLRSQSPCNNLASLNRMLSDRSSSSQSATSNNLLLNERSISTDRVDVSGKISLTSPDTAEEDGEKPPKNHFKFISHVDATGQHSMLRSKTILKPQVQHSGQLYGHAYDQRDVDDVSESSGTKSRLDSLEMMLGGDDNRSLDLRNSGSVMSNDLFVLNDCGNREWNGSISCDSQSSLGDSPTPNCLPLTLDSLEVASNSFSLIKPLAQRG